MQFSVLKRWDADPQSQMSLNGGDGYEVASYAGSAAAISVSLATGVNSGDAQGDVFTSIEAILGTGYSDALIGDAAANDLRGDAGNDTLAGGAGADTLDGGVGTDVVSYATSTAGVSVNIATGVGTGGDAQGDTLISVEQVIGSGFAGGRLDASAPGAERAAPSGRPFSLGP